jgi:hypothetical protein
MHHMARIKQACIENSSDDLQDTEPGTYTDWDPKSFMATWHCCHQVAVGIVTCVA